MSDSYLIATDDTFDAVVRQAAMPVLLDFWAPWCAPCLSLGRVLEQILPEYADRLLLVKVDADENRATCAVHGVRTIPRLSLYRDGKETIVIEERTRARLERFLEEQFPV